MKKIIRAAFFLGGLVILLFLASLVLVPKNNSARSGMLNARAYGFLAEPENSLDVLVVGDSLSYSSYVPLKIWEKYGITSYCAGAPIQKLPYTLDTIKRAMENQSPKIVLLETDSIFRKVGFKDIVSQYMEKLFPIFTFHSRWKSLTLADFTLDFNYTTIEPNKGYRFSDKVTRVDVEDIENLKPKTANIEIKNYEYVDRIKKLCDEKGAKLVLYSAPSLVNWNMDRHKALIDLAQKLELTYLDLNLLRAEVPIDWKTDSRDKGDHLNYYGAIKVSNYLGEYLENTHLFTSHKADKRYEQWNEALKIFNEKLKQLIIGVAN